MSEIDSEENVHQPGHRVGLAVALVAIAALTALALFLAVRVLAPGGGRASLSLYGIDGEGRISAQVQYACDGDPCGERDRLFFSVTGEGIEKPTEARVGGAEITEAVIRDQENGLLVYFSIPPDEPGYSIIDFPCAKHGEALQVEVVVESDDGAAQSSASGQVACPSE